MVGTIGILSILLIFLITQYKHIKQLKERKWVYLFVLVTAGISLFLSLPFSFNGLTEYLNMTVGYLTKMVVS